MRRYRFTISETESQWNFALLTPGRVFRSARWSASALWAHGRVFTDKGRAVDERLPTGLSASVYSFGRIRESAGLLASPSTMNLSSSLVLT
jgi:hypothetical protein